MDGVLAEDADFSEGGGMPRIVPSEFSEGGVLTVVAREAYERRDSGEGLSAG